MKKCLCLFFTVLILIMGRTTAGDRGGSPGLSASSAILIESRSGRILYEHNADEKRLIASTTKIMTALIALELADIQDIVTVPQEAEGVEGSSLYLKAGEQLLLIDLLYGLMLRSGNDAAVAIAHHVGGDVSHFVAQMNRKAWELGMSNTSFTNPHGLNHPQHYSTARDLAILGAAALKNPILREIAETPQHITTPILEGGQGRTFLNKNRLLSEDFRAIGLKIGYTIRAGRCLVAAASQNGIELVAVVLDAPNWYEDCSRLFDFGYNGLETIELMPAGKVLAAVPVSGGHPARVPASLAEALMFPVWPGETVSFHTEIVIDQPLAAPIHAGQRLGKVITIVDHRWKLEVDLVAAEPVALVRNKWWQQILNWVRSWGYD